MLLRASRHWQALKLLCNVNLTSDPTGNLNFAGKASIGTDGVQFSNGALYSIKLDDFTPLAVLGRGQFGVVQKVLHKPTQVIMCK